MLLLLLLFHCFCCPIENFFKYKSVTIILLHDHTNLFPMFKNVVPSFEFFQMSLLVHQLRLSSCRRLISSTSSLLSSKPRNEDDIPHPLQVLSEQETGFVKTVRQFADTVIKPLVREMDRTSEMTPAVINGCFENGVLYESNYPVATLYGLATKQMYFLINCAKRCAFKLVQ